MTYPGKELNVRIDSLTNKYVPPVEFEVRKATDLPHLRERWGAMDSIPKLLAARTAGEDNSFLNLDVRTLLRGEESAGRHAVHSIVLPAGIGLPAHGLESGNATWFVIRGEVEVTIGALTRRLKAPACAYAPEHTTQVIANRSRAHAEVCVIHSPAGADRAFAAAHEQWLKCRPEAAVEQLWAAFAPYGFILTGGKALANDARTNAVAERIAFDVQRIGDLAALRERWCRLAPIPKIVEFPCESPNLVPIAGSETRLILTPEESRSHASAFFNAIGKGLGAPAHHQISEDEFFLIVSGSLRLRVGNAVETAQSSAFGYAPRNATHTFTGEADELTVFYTMNSPGGHDRGFEAGVREAASFDTPHFHELMEAHGFTFHQGFISDELIKIPSVS